MLSPPRTAPAAVVEPDQEMCDPERVREIVLDGKVTPEHTRESYGVVVDPETREIDEERTAERRSRRTRRADPNR